MTPGESAGEPVPTRFTVEEANRAIPELVDILEGIRASRQVVLAGARSIKRSSKGNGGGAMGAAYLEALSGLEGAVRGLADRGIVLRDPEEGLVDFPGEREGREIFLCWKLGEPEVAYWHSPQGGFGGRKPL